MHWNANRYNPIWNVENFTFDLVTIDISHTNSDGIYFFAMTAPASQAGRHFAEGTRTGITWSAKAHLVSMKNSRAL